MTALCSPAVLILPRNFQYAANGTALPASEVDCRIRRLCRLQLFAYYFFAIILHGIILQVQKVV